MNNYIIYTDSGCDIKPSLLQEWGVQYSCLIFRFDDADVEYSNDDMDITTFYDKMRAGGIAKTSAINIEKFTVEFEKWLKQGFDILYLGFSGGLSATYNSAYIAADQLREEYPERKIITVDTLSASAGQGLLLYLTVEQKKNGATIEEAAAYAESIKQSICHWVTVDDLVYLKRGGRISSTAAFFGNTLSIKPIIHVDNEGHLINVSKVRGRKSSLSTLANKYGELAMDPANGTIFISHSDCEKDVEELAKLLKSKYDATVDVVTDIGPVIGAHTGPGAIAIFFVGKER